MGKSELWWESRSSRNSVLSCKPIECQVGCLTSRLGVDESDVEYESVKDVSELSHKSVIGKKGNDL